MSLISIFLNESEEQFITTDMIDCSARKNIRCYVAENDSCLQSFFINDPLDSRRLEQHGRSHSLRSDMKRF